MVDKLPATVYRRRRIAVVAGLGVALVLLVAGVVAATSGGDDPGPGTEPGGAGRTSTTGRSTTTTRTGATTSTTVPTGRFTTAAGGSAVVGTGPLQTYTVEVEQGTGQDPEAFAAQVDRILADRRGWTTEDGVAFQRVDHGPATFTVRLATPDTTDVLCLPLDTANEVSCGQNGAAVLNLDRWLEGAEPSKLDLADYRNYLVSHEVGHLLGHHHVTCPGPGVLAPTMMQQTLDIGACAPNPWPAPDA